MSIRFDLTSTFTLNDFHRLQLQKTKKQFRNRQSVLSCDWWADQDLLRRTDETVGPTPGTAKSTSACPCQLPQRGPTYWQVFSHLMGLLTHPRGNYLTWLSVVCFWQEGISFSSLLADDIFHHGKKKKEVRFETGRSVFEGYHSHYPFPFVVVHLLTLTWLSVPVEIFNIR